MRSTWPLRRLAAVALAAACLVATGRAAPLQQGEEAKLRERALKLNLVTGDHPIRGQIISLLENKEGAKKLLAEALKMAREAEKDKTKDAPFNVNATHILARVARGLGEQEAGEYFFKLNAKQAMQLGSSAKFVDAYTSLIDLYYRNKKFAEAEKACREFLEEDGDRHMRRMKVLVLRRMVQTQAKQGKVEEALKVVENLINVQPKNWLMLELKGWVLREAKRFDEAAKIYEDVLDKIQNDDRLDKEQKENFGGDIRYTLSGVYVDLKKIDKAAGHLKTLLEKNKDNPTFYNDLGFIWADHDMNLDEAEKLIRKAIELDREQFAKANPNAKDGYKGNAAYLDSLGWVLYKKKKYKEALPALLEAVKQDDGQHLEIYDHLGEVYVALGDLEKALDAWRKGLTCKELSYRDEARKVKVKKKIEKYERQGKKD